jgi:hypothetical protein
MDTMSWADYYEPPFVVVGSQFGNRRRPPD